MLSLLEDKKIEEFASRDILKLESRIKFFHFVITRTYNNEHISYNNCIYYK